MESDLKYVSDTLKNGVIKMSLQIPESDTTLHTP